MKKIIKYLSTFLSCFMLFTIGVNASSYDVTVTSNSVTVGNTITLTVKGSELAGKFTLTSSNTSVASLSNSSIWIDNNSQNITINTKKAGNVTITITATDVTDYDGKTITGSKTINLTVKNKTTNNSSSSNNSYVPKNKSKNNFLSSLTIDGIELETEFNKDTLEYTATAKPETTLININAQLEDSSAKAEGTGEKEVKTGTNSFEIKVTAENGDTRVYKLVVNVPEPKIIEIDNKQYTVVNSDEGLEIPEGYEKTSIKIDEEEVTAYYNETTKYNLIVLKDNEDKINYYVYDNDKYTLYKEYNFSGVRLHLLDYKTPKNYIETELNINEDKIKAYKLKTNNKNTTYALKEDDITNYYLVYGMNINNGKKGYYLIDTVENTAIRYNEKLNSLFLETKTNDNYKTYFFITLGALGLVVLVFSITLITNGKKNKNKFSF